MAQRQFSTVLDYQPILWHLGLIEEPVRSACIRLYVDQRDRFEQAPGSSANHQAWRGGYADHVCEVLNYARHLYQLQSALGRPQRFSLSDALTVLFLHDLEKPFRLSQQANGFIHNDPALQGKKASRDLREKLISDYDIHLTPAQQNALRYVEGEGVDYSRTQRVMNELAAFCHQADIWSARQCPDYPRSLGDGWVGASRASL